MRRAEDSTEGSGDTDDIDGYTDSWAITALPRENIGETRVDRVDSRASAPRATPSSSVPVSARARVCNYHGIVGDLFGDLTRFDWL